VHGVIIEIGDVTKARPVRVTPRPLQQRFQWTAPLNPINQRITTRGESKPERRSGERIIAGTAFRLEFQVR